MYESACRFGSFLISESNLAAPEHSGHHKLNTGLTSSVATLAATSTLKDTKNIDLKLLNVIVVYLNDNHTESNIELLLSTPTDTTKNTHQTLATYTALAIGSCGYALTFTGPLHVLSNAIETAITLACKTKNSSSMLITVAKNKVSWYQANSVLIRGTIINDEAFSVKPTFEKNLYSHLSQTFNKEFRQRNFKYSFVSSF